MTAPAQGRHRRVGRLTLAAALIAAPLSAQWQIDSKDGKASLKVGLLAQPQGEWVETADGSGYSQNLFLRRLRILLGGSLTDRWSFFFETDSPNLGKADAQGVKNEADIFVQDFFVTYSHNDAFKVDAGLLLLPLSHNHGQSAATLLPVDYCPYTFAGCVPLKERVGRDYGVAVRGYPFGRRLEYRAGVLQGLRGSEARNPLRVLGRLVYYPFDAETGYFYGGTFQGGRKVLAIGASYDAQKDYRSYAVDVFYEQPIRKGEQGFTGQFDWLHLDGGALAPTLPRQDTYLVEAGYHLKKGRFTPFVQYSRRSFDASVPDQSAWQAGLAWWVKGHNRNLKASAGRLHTDGQPDRTQVLVQLQIFYY